MIVLFRVITDNLLFFIYIQFKYRLLDPLYCTTLFLPSGLLGIVSDSFFIQSNRKFILGLNPNLNTLIVLPRP